MSTTAQVPAATQGSIILPAYGSGQYFATHPDPDLDDQFKVDAFLKLLEKVDSRHLPVISSYADVGCGSGGVAQFLYEGMFRGKQVQAAAAAYDISPHVLGLSRPHVEFHMQDFCETDKHYSLVTLFDVVEHVPDPVGFLKSVSARCDFIGLHIPLDRSLANCLFDRFHHRLLYPGHLSILDAPQALNLVTMAGITPVDYSYTHGYSAPSGRLTPQQNIAYPFRYALAHLSPWLASKLVGGVSLMVFGATKTGLKKMTF